MARNRSVDTATATRTPIASLRGLIAALAVVVGALHLMIADTRGADWPLEGIALATIGLVALGLSAALLRTSAMWPLIGMIVVSLAVIVGLVVTRTIGYPFGPFEDAAPELGSLDILVLVLGTTIVSTCGASTILGTGRIGAPGLRFDTLAPVAVAVVSLPGIAVSSWTDEAAYIAGAAHVHGSTTIDSSSQHGFAYRAELTIEERSRLADQLTSARSAALSTPNLASAVAAGWTPVGDIVPGGGQMMIDLDLRRVIADFDPSRPVALLFASADDDAPIVAVQYEGWTKSTTPPVGFTGQDAFWHLHTGTCLVDDVRVVYDEPHVGTDCEILGGTRTNTISWMIRAWVVPGWENPNGTFAHDHPGVG